MAAIGKTARQSLGYAKPPVGHREQRERREIIVGHGERVGAVKARGLALATESYARLPESGADLCSQPTLSRLENAPSLKDAIRLTRVTNPG